MNISKIYNKINNNKLNQRKMYKPQMQIEKKHYRKINNEIQIDIKSQRQLNVKGINNFNNEHFATDYNNDDYNTLDNQNVRCNTNINDNKNLINKNQFYNNHDNKKSTFNFKKIPTLIANERNEKDKYPNLNFNNGINEKIITSFLKHKILPNNKYNKITNINNPSLNKNIRKNINLNKQNEIIKRNIYQNDNNSINYNIDVANDKKSLLLESGNKNKIHMNNNVVHAVSTPFLNRNSDIKSKRLRSFRRINILNNNH